METPFILGFIALYQETNPFKGVTFARMVMRFVALAPASIEQLDPPRGIADLYLRLKPALRIQHGARNVPFWSFLVERENEPEGKR